MAEYKRVSEENLLYFATKTAQKVKAMIGGFNPTSIVFGADGSITETASTKVTTFSGNTITETLTWTGGTREIKTTTFNADGTITITYS